MKKLISYIFKLLIFFKSAKADLLDFALEFRIDDRTDNYIKYMTELTKISTNRTISADQWSITDYLTHDSIITRLNSDKSIKLTFDDTILNVYTGFSIRSSDVFADQISGRITQAVNSTDMDYQLNDYLVHESRTVKEYGTQTILMNDELTLAKRRVLALDYNATPTYDEYHNAIYPYLYDSNGHHVLRENYNVL